MKSRVEKRLCKSQFFENRESHQAEQTLVDSSKWLTTKEAAQLLRVSISALKTMVHRGQVPAFKLGRRNRFLKEDLDRLITPINKSEV